MNHLFINRAATILFWIGIIAIVILSLLPAKAIPNVGVNDKIEHGFAYFLLASCGLLACQRWWGVVSGLVLLGGILELGQGAMGWNRYADWADFFANSCGVLLALAIVSVLKACFVDRSKTA